MLASGLATDARAHAQSLLKELDQHEILFEA